MSRKPGEPSSTEAGSKDREKRHLRRETEERIHGLQAKSFRGMWAFSAFLLVSIGALNDFRFFPPLSANIVAMLGSPPSSEMISGLLVLYSFSAIIFILSRMMKGVEPSLGLAHVFYLSVFYLFYKLAGSLQDYFWAVFTSGFTILSLENFHNIIRYRPLIREEQERLRKLDENGAGPDGK